MFNVHLIAVSIKIKQKIQKHYGLSSVDQKKFSQRGVSWIFWPLVFGARILNILAIANRCYN